MIGSLDSAVEGSIDDAAHHWQVLGHFDHRRLGSSYNNHRSNNRRPTSGQFYLSYAFGHVGRDPRSQGAYRVMTAAPGLQCLPCPRLGHRLKPWLIVISVSMTLTDHHLLLDYHY